MRQKCRKKSRNSESERERCQIRSKMMEKKSTPTDRKERESGRK